MTRKEIVDAVDFEIISIHDAKFDPTIWSTIELENAMVAAYNRAIEDAINLGEGDWFVHIGEIEKLKIKE